MAHVNRIQGISLFESLIENMRYGVRYPKFIRWAQKDLIYKQIFESYKDVKIEIIVIEVFSIL
jgi:hypothetical protein